MILIAKTGAHHLLAQDRANELGRYPFIPDLIDPTCPRYPLPIIILSPPPLLNFKNEAIAWKWLFALMMVPFKTRAPALDVDQEVCASK